MMDSKINVGLNADADRAEADCAEADCGDLLLRTAGLEIHTKNQRVWYQGALLPLKGLTYRLLETLVLAEQQAVSSQLLAQRVWRNSHVTDETLAQRVSLLRKALGLLPADLIESVRGEGYRWTASVVVETCRSPQRDPVAQRSAAAPQALFARQKVYLAALLCLPVAGALYLGLWQHDAAAVKALPVPTAPVSTAPALATPVQPAALQKAFDYARQNTAAGNAIAIDLFTAFLQQHPAHVGARVGLVAAQIAGVVKFNGNEQLLDFAAQQIDLLANSDVSRWELAKLRGYYFDARGDIAQAIYHYEQAIAADSSAMAQVASSLAYLYVRKGRMYEALQLNLTGLKQHNNYTLLQIAEILYLSGFHAQSKAWVALAYQFAPNDAFVATQYARDAKARGEGAAAYQALYKLHQYAAGTADSYIALALLAIEDQQWTVAQQALQQADQLEPGSLYSQSLSYWLRKNNYIKGSAVRPDTQSQSPVWPNWHVAKSMVELADADYAGAKTSLTTAVAAGFLDQRYLQALPVFDVLRNDPEFQALQQQMLHAVNTERSKISTVSLPDPAALMQAE